MDTHHDIRTIRRVDKQNTRPTIGLLTKNATYILLRGVADAAREYDVNLITFLGETLHSPHGFEAQANVLYKLVSAERLDALIIWTAILDWFVTQEEMEAFCRQFLPLPVVIINDGIAYDNLPCIHTDHYYGMRELLVHLIERHDYRKIAFIRGPEGDLAVQDRYRAYVDTLADYDIPLNPNLVTPPCYWDAGAEMLNLLLDERRLRPPADIDAIVGASDGLLLQEPNAWEVLRQKGFRLPEDLALVGADDYEEGLVFTPPLSTVRPAFYEAGHKAVETALTILRGESVPMRQTLPSTLVLRQSCGCSTSAVLETTPPSDSEKLTMRAPDDSFGTSFVERRQAVLSHMKHSAGTSGIANEWLEQVLDAFSSEMEGITSSRFLATLHMVLLQTMEAKGVVSAWHGIIAALRQCVLSSLSERDLSLAELLWHQAQIAIGETAQRAQAHLRVKEAQHANMLAEVGQALRTTPDLETMIDVVAQELPRVGISRCYLSLYEDRHAPGEWSRLLLAYDRTGRMIPEIRQQRFLSQHLAPESVWPKDTRYSIAVEALYFRNNQLGFAVFEGDPQKGPVRDLLQASAIARMQRSRLSLTGTLYAELRGQLSSALQGVLLVQKVQGHAVEITRQHAEITRKNYILDTFMVNVPDQIYFKDRDSRITHANPAYVRRIGLSQPEDVLGKSDFDFFPEEQARGKYAQEQEIMRTGRPLLALEEDNGQNAWSLTTKMPLRNEHGDIIGTFGISRDISSLKHTQAALERAYAEILALNTDLHDENLRFYTRSLLLGSPTPGVSADGKRRLPENWKQPHFCVILVKLLLTSTDRKSSRDASHELLNAVLRLYEEYVHAHPLSGMSNALTPTEAVLILNIADPAQAQALCSFILSRSERVLSEQGAAMLMGIGEETDNPRHLSGSYETARKALLFRINAVGSQVIAFDDIKHQDNDALLLSFPIEYEQKLITAVLSGQYVKVLESVNEILAQNDLERSSYQKLLALYTRFMQTAAKILIRVPGIQSTDTRETSLLESFRESEPGTVTELRKRVLDLFHQLTEFYPRKAQQRSELLKEQLLTYLGEQYTDPNLSLDSLARVFNLSPKYLSRLFKEQIGMKYLDYLTMLRINKAKQLLVTHPDLKISELCQQVGFFYPGTFIKTFKKREGMTPGGYRQRAVKRKVEK